MSNLSKFEFTALEISGNNYPSWAFDAKTHLEAMSLGETIIDGNKTSLQEKTKAMAFLRLHLHEDLKRENRTVEDPLELWKNIQERFDHLKLVLLSKTRYRWVHLRLRDHKTVSEYNSAFLRITSELKLCGEQITEKDMIEQTISTFHLSNMLLAQQYREHNFTKYSELISCLLVVEQNNKLILQNH
ncbi:uncharacterized protein LOC110873347 [Helianthus annuus]|uniref:uncharacterized protein LOC110873347 n=1 Tax=Helianthus annuus TaxID=4232 RepID=UPI0016530E73|nr:uncharacterized protein LOC110873347 [Helianthus annuus]